MIELLSRLGFCTLLLALCPIANAQQPAKVPRIGYLSVSSETTSSEQGFRQALRDLGYIDGQNLGIERRSADGNVDRIPELITELVRLKVDVIVVTSVQGAMAAKKTTQNIPIVFAIAQDPVASGLVTSLAKPLGNLTGVTDFARELAGKRLELLKETVPKVSRVAVLLWKPAGPDYPAERKEIEITAQALGVQLELAEIRGAGDLENAFWTMTRANAAAIMGLTDTRFAAHRKRIVELSRKNRFPGVYPDRAFVEDGGLMSYATNRTEWRRRIAFYVDRILKGPNPLISP